MARISELHYSDALASSSGVSEFLEVALTPAEHANPEEFTISFYEATGTVAFQVSLEDVADDFPGRVSYDAASNEYVYVISAEDYPILLSNADTGGISAEAFALVEGETESATVHDFYDIGTGTSAITALDGPAQGAVSQNIAVATGADADTTTIQFNQPNTTTASYGAPEPGQTNQICFVSGTLIETPFGPRPVEDLMLGDLVLTADHGAQPLRWRAAQKVAACGRAAPIRFPSCAAMGQEELFVSPQHHMLIRGWQAQLFFGADAVLAPARSFVGRSGVRRVERPYVVYHHLLFDRHAVITANGFETESFLPGRMSIEALALSDREALFAFCPDLRVAQEQFGYAARPLLRAREAAAMALSV